MPEFGVPPNGRDERVWYVVVADYDRIWAVLRWHVPNQIEQFDRPSGTWELPPPGLLRYFVEDGGITDSVPGTEAVAEAVSSALRRRGPPVVFADVQSSEGSGP